MCINHMGKLYYNEFFCKFKKETKNYIYKDCFNFSIFVLLFK